MDDNPRSDKTRLDPLTIMRRWVAPVAASAGIALVLAAAVDFINGASPPPRAAKKTPRPATSKGTGTAAVPTLMSKDRPLPRHLVGVRRPGTAVVVRDVRTLAPIGSIPAPANRRFQQVAAAGAGSYIVSGAARNGTVFYRLTLASDGRPAPLTALPRVRVPGTSTAWSDMAISQDGGTIAYVSYRTATRRPAIDAVSVDTGARRTWTTALSGRIGALSWAGRTLSFVWSPTRGAIRHQVRLLDTALPGGDLKVSRPALTLPAGADTAVVSRDGATIVTGVAGRSGLSLAAYSVASGRQTAVLWRRSGGPSRVIRLIPDRAGGDLIAATPGGRLIVAPAHGAIEATAADIADLAW
jgi:hypothetical protein